MHLVCISPAALAPMRAERREGARPSDLPEPLAQSLTGSGSDIGDNRTQSHSLSRLIEIVCPDVKTLVMILLIFCTTSESMNDLDLRNIYFQIEPSSLSLVEIVNCQIVIKNRTLHQGQGGSVSDSQYGTNWEHDNQLHNTRQQHNEYHQGETRRAFVSINTNFSHLIYY